jgi:hypothetical protein
MGAHASRTTAAGGFAHDFVSPANGGTEPPPLQPEVRAPTVAENPQLAREIAAAEVHFLAMANARRR